MPQKTAPLLSLVVAIAWIGLPLSPAHAVSLPGIKASQKNSVPGCVTPGRLMSYLEDNNSKLRPRFKSIAMYYMRHGEALGLRWDYAFFQMLVETGFLRFKGDVNWKQNNFAGLGATGGGVRGEAFKSVESGVKAHLEHLSMYAGAYVPNPTAERTRKIQQWKVLAKWQRHFKNRAMTFKDMAGKWAPGSRGYPRDIEFVGERFFSGFCDKPDPQPELVFAARGKTAKNKKTKLAKAVIKPAANSAAATKKKPDTASRSNLGATASKSKMDSKRGDSKVPQQTASISGAANTTAKSVKSTTGKTQATKATCRVWSASYGGTKAVIIKAVDNSVINYTVLKVNDGRVQPEAKAYIHAYAKGGSLLDQFANPDQALEKAFQLCPEG